MAHNRKEGWKEKNRRLKNLFFFSPSSPFLWTPLPPPFVFNSGAILAPQVFQLFCVASPCLLQLLFSLPWLFRGEIESQEALTFLFTDKSSLEQNPFHLRIFFFCVTFSAEQTPTHARFFFRETLILLFLSLSDQRLPGIRCHRAADPCQSSPRLLLRFGSDSTVSETEMER